MNSKCGVQSKRRRESRESCVFIVGFSACGCQKKSVVYETEHTVTKLEKDVVYYTTSEYIYIYNQTLYKVLEFKRDAIYYTTS